MKMTRISLWKSLAKSALIVLLLIALTTSVYAAPLEGKIESNNSPTILAPQAPLEPAQTQSPIWADGMPPVAPPHQLRITRDTLNGRVNDSGNLPGFNFTPSNPQLATGSPNLNQGIPQLGNRLFPPTQAFSPSASGGQDEYWLDWEGWRQRVQQKLLATRIAYERSHALIFAPNECFVECTIHKNGDITNIRSRCPTLLLTQSANKVVRSIAHSPELQFPASVSFVNTR